MGDVDDRQIEARMCHTEPIESAAAVDQQDWLGKKVGVNVARMCDRSYTTIHCRCDTFSPW